jgi:hypothetical protein
MPASPALCPSARCEPGALLLGIVLPNGRIGYTRERIAVDDEFVQIARQGRAPEKRFRFSSPCVQGACRQWSAGRCRVIDDVVAELESSQGAQILPECTIRPACRWFLQRGAAACRVCPLVITDRRAGCGSQAERQLGLRPSGRPSGRQ